MNAPLLEARGASRVFGGGLFERRRIVAVQDATLLIPDDPPVIVAIWSVARFGASKCFSG